MDRYLSACILLFGACAVHAQRSSLSPTRGSTFGSFTPTFAFTRGFTGTTPPGVFSDPKRDCPRECSLFCQSVNVATCYAVNSRGEVRQDFLDKLPLRLQMAYNETSNSNNFRLTAKLATCEGFVSYMRAWDSFPRAVKDNIAAMFRDVATMSDAAFMSIPKIVFDVIERTVERGLYQNMLKKQKLWLCKNLKSESCLTRAAIAKRVDCPSLLVSAGAKIDPNDIYDMLDLDNTTGWDNDKWNMTLMNFPEVLTPEKMRECPIDILVEGMKDLADVCDKLDSRMVYAIAKRVTDKVSDLKSKTQLSNDIKDAWKKFVSVCNADPALFKGIVDSAELLSTVNLKKLSGRNLAKFMEEEMQNIDASDLSADEITNSIKALVLDRTKLKALNTSLFADAVPNICAQAADFDKGELRKIADAVFTDIPEFNDPSNFDGTTLTKAGCLLPFMPKRKRDNIPTNVLTNALSSSTMKGITIQSRSLARSLVEKAKSTFSKPDGRFSKDDLDKMGDAVLSLKPDEIDKIDPSSFDKTIMEKVAASMKDSGMGITEASKKMFVKKMIAGAGLKELAKTEFVKEIPLKDLRDADISDFDDLIGENTENDMEFDIKQARILAEKVKDAIGNIEEGNTNYTLQRVTNIKPLMCGFTKEEIKNFTRDSSFSAILNAISESKCLTREVAKTIYELNKDFMKFDSTDKATLQAATGSSTIRDMSPKILSFYSKDELNKFATTVCGDVMDRLKDADLEMLSKKEIQDKMDYFKECLNKGSGAITTTDVEKMGKLLCGLRSSDIKRLDADVFDAYTSVLDKCPYDESERQVIVDTFVNKKTITNGATVSTSDLMELGSLVANLPESIQRDIPDRKLVDASETVMKSFKEREDAEKEREKAGYKNDRSDSDKNTYKNKKKTFCKNVLTKMETVRAASGPSAGRRRRSAAALTCTDLQALGTSGLSALTTTQINNLGDQDFIDCAELLGSVSDYSDDQESALLTVASRNTIWGDSSTWTSANVYDAGVIVQAMTASQISNLNMDLNAVSRLGTFSGWDSTKLAAVFDRWLTLEKSGSTANIVASELQSLGHVTCGATTAHINSLPNSVYQGAADSVGQVTSCEASQLQAFAAHAKTAYGNDVTTWTGSTVSTIGIVIGGLSAAEIATLSESQIDVIDPNHITYIPASTFTGFTSSQLSTFSVTQAQATTLSQRNALTSSQMDALSSAANMNWTVVDNGSNAVHGVSMLLAFLVVSMMHLL